MAPPLLEVADIFRKYGEDYRKTYGAAMSPEQHRVMRAIEICRTAALGGHVYKCNHDECGYELIAYNSCRNRHCPKCQALAKAQWLEARRAELLPVDYYHIVFTLLDDLLAPIALQNKRVFYDILYRAASQTLLKVAADPDQHLGAQIGFMAILHTWGQRLNHHPHIHCVTPGGGLSADGKIWIPSRKNYFLDVHVLSCEFRNRFLHLLERAFRKGQLEFHGRIEHLSNTNNFDQLIKSCGEKDWVVYSKPPFSGPEKVLDYLARYTHRIAISTHRLLTMDDGKVQFTWRDYKHGNIQQTMTLDAHEFIRRFLMHVLPDGFVRIRYFGFLTNRYRAKNLQLCRQLLNVKEQAADTRTPEKQDWAERLLALTGKDPLKCPKCQQGRLIHIKSLSPMDELSAKLHLAAKLHSPPNGIQDAMRSFHNKAPPEGNLP
jgi:hypothetical protein